jgi:hypothetical protein
MTNTKEENRYGVGRSVYVRWSLAGNLENVLAWEEQRGLVLTGKVHKSNTIF